MPDVPFISGKGGRLQLKVGAGATMNVPCVGGEGYTVGDNDVVERLAQGGAFGAAPGNILMGLNTPVLDVAARLFVPNAGAGWFSASNLLAMFGLAEHGDIAVRDNLNGDIPLIDVAYSNGADAITDQMKLARFSLEGSGQTNQLLARMTFLGLNKASTATFGTYSAAGGTPLYWKHMNNIQWAPEGGSVAQLTLVESCAFTINTGVAFAKWNDGTDNPSGLDPLDMSGAMTVAQRAGATARMCAARNGRLSISINSGEVDFLIGLNRLGRPRQMNPTGGITDVTNWQMVRTAGDFCAIGST